MSYEVPEKHLGLEDADDTCSHTILSLLHACSLSKLDIRQAGNHDHKIDPYTLTVEEECPRCGYYLKQFLQMIMATSELIPTTDKFFCTGCFTIREVPGKGKGSFALSCYNCRKQVAESWAEFLTALAALSVFILGECYPL